MINWLIVKVCTKIKYRESDVVFIIVNAMSVLRSTTYLLYSKVFTKPGKDGYSNMNTMKLYPKPAQLRLAII